MTSLSRLSSYVPSCVVNYRQTALYQAARRICVAIKAIPESLWRFVRMCCATLRANKRVLRKEDIRIYHEKKEVREEIKLCVVVYEEITIHKETRKKEPELMCLTKKTEDEFQADRISLKPTFYMKSSPLLNRVMKEEQVVFKRVDSE